MPISEEAITVLTQTNDALIALGRYLQYGATGVPEKIAERWLSLAHQLRILKFEPAEALDEKVLQAITEELVEAWREVKLQRGRLDKNLKRCTQLGRLTRQFQTYLKQQGISVK